MRPTRSPARGLAGYKHSTNNGPAHALVCDPVVEPKKPLVKVVSSTVKEASSFMSLSRTTLMSLPMSVNSMVTV